MFVRKSLAGAVAAAVAGATVALSAGTAHAAYAPHENDSKQAPVSADLIGAGSDTSEHALFLLAQAWNGGAKADYGQTFDIATFSALGGGDLPAPVKLDQGGGAVVRPNGSGPGRNTLYGATRASEVDFARSSGAPSQAQYDQGMRTIPFALDTVVPAVSGSNAAAAASLTLAQLKDIYVTCATTNWNQVGGGNAPIEPFVPKSGSGTESFFKSSLGLASTDNYGACVKDHTDDANPDTSAVQEHDPGLFTLKPNAIVPFSKGRAGLAGAAVKVVGGDQVAFKRNLYNVVRTEEAARADIQAVFGETGFVCSAAAHDIIKAAGFDQLAGAALGGDCGKVMSAASSNFTTNTITTPTVAVSGAGTAGAVNLTAKVASNPAAVGSVTFSEGATVLASNVKIVSGQAVTTPLALAAGSHTIKAVFTPGQSNFLTAEATSTITIDAAVVTPPEPGDKAAVAKLKKQIKNVKAKIKKAKKAKKTAKVKKLKKKLKAAQA